MKKQLGIFLLILIWATAACSTIRLEYKAKAKDSKGQLNKVLIQRSYPVGGAFEPLCYITAIGLGGVCWFYTVMPTTDQKAQMRADAKDLITKQMGEKAEITDETVSRISWDQAPDEIHYQINDN